MGVPGIHVHLWCVRQVLFLLVICSYGLLENLQPITNSRAKSMSTGIFLPLVQRDRKSADSMDTSDGPQLAGASTPTTATPRSVGSISSLGTDALSLLHIEYDLLANNCSLVGAGASASVWTAKSRLTGAYVAVKTVSRQAYSSVGLNEGEVLRNLQSVPGVVRIVDSYIDADIEVIVMELCSGTDLQRWESDELDTGTVKSIVYDLITVLKNIHNLGFAHMDIRLENIIAEKDSITGGVHMTLVDFGSSIESVADAARDIRNTGILLYELLSGIRFPEGSSCAPLRDLLVEDAAALRLIDILMSANNDNRKSVIEAAIAHEWFRGVVPCHISIQ